MKSKFRTPKRLLLDKELIKLLATSPTLFIQGGAYPTSSPREECSFAFYC
jgi:hypothetical protein